MSDDQPINDPRDLFAATPAPPTGGDEWNASAPAKGVRMPVPVLVALVAIVALVGLWGGAQLKGDSSSAAAVTGPQGARRGYFNGGAGGAPGQGNGAGAGRGVFGTVASVDGDTITLTTADGSTVKVTVGSGTTITKSATASVSDIAAGDTLVVRGTTTDGTTQATSINIGGAGGFGGFGPGAGPPADPPAAAN